MNEQIKKLMHPSFLICIAVLFTAGLSLQAVVQKLGVSLTKEAIPLQNPFEELDESKLEPFAVRQKSRITNDDILEQLGTEEYLQWLMEDTEAGSNSPVKYCQLFITYYTGNPDAVPHVPEECYTGAGSKPLGYYSMHLKLRKEGAPYTERLEGMEIIPDEMDIRQIGFSSSSSGLLSMGQKFSVLYFFKTNGKYAANRTETREILSTNFFSKYSYFCKVEWKFFGSSYGNMIYPTNDELVAASERLMRIVLPVLEEDHWPDWEKINQKDGN